MATKDHVIGRRFVPSGSLAGSWNLILQSCRKCNEEKADLEDDISAITMGFHAAGLTGLDGEIYRREVARKARRSISRMTGRPVADSAAAMKMSLQPFPGLQMTMNFNAPAQLDDKRVLQLARLQMLGFFYMLTYKEESRRGFAWRGNFLVLHGAIKADWGNPIHRAFTDAVSDWDYRLVATVANGCVRVAIRKHPEDDCWSWAVEWNGCYRLLGFFGNEETARSVAANMPELPMQSIFEAQDGWVRYRIDKRLPEADEDKLFLAQPVA